MVLYYNVLDVIYYSLEMWKSLGNLKLKIDYKIMVLCLKPYNSNLIEN